jgi:hypothetical protein
MWIINQRILIMAMNNGICGKIPHNYLLDCPHGQGLVMQANSDVSIANDTHQLGTDSW